MKTLTSGALALDATKAGVETYPTGLRTFFVSRQGAKIARKNLAVLASLREIGKRGLTQAKRVSG